MDERPCAARGRDRESPSRIVLAPLLPFFMSRPLGLCPLEQSMETHLVVVHVARGMTTLSFSSLAIDGSPSKASS